MQGDKNLRHRRSSRKYRFKARGAGFAEPVSRNFDLGHQLTYMQPVPSIKAAKVVGRKKRNSRAESREWERTIRSAARAAFR